MPAIYAHDRFGAEVSGRLDGDLREIINKYYPQFSIGLQGPDIFFFYRPFYRNRINKYGSLLHHVSALPFFKHALSVVRRNSRNSREYAYLMGFICHFILDSECHPYVERMIHKTGVQHLEIEEEFEKFLLRADGHNPFSWPLADLVPTDALTAEALCPFYGKSITRKTARTSLRYMKLVKRLFTAPGTLKYNVIRFLMKTSGRDASVRGLLHQRKDHPACRETNAGLLIRFENAETLATDMIADFDESLKNGKPLNPRFDRTFE